MYYKDVAYKRVIIYTEISNIFFRSAKIFWFCKISLYVLYLAKLKIIAKQY